MKHLKKILLSVFIPNTFILGIWYMLFLLNACNPQPDEEIFEIKKQLVVDGWIEQNEYANVILTYNTSYFSNLDSASFRSLVATRAKVTLIADHDSEVLTQTKDTNYFPPYLYKSTEIKGKVGHTYNLLIEDEIGTVTATTQILAPVSLDSVWFQTNNNSDSLGVIKGVFSDNISSKDYYRTFTKIKSKNKRFYPTLVSNFEDKYFNGQSFKFSLELGPESYLQPIKNIYFKKGDTITLKVTRIDSTAFSFWLSYFQEVFNSGNPFAASHNKMPTNINGGLGIWCGYGASNYRIIAK